MKDSRFKLKKCEIDLIVNKKKKTIDYYYIRSKKKQKQIIGLKKSLIIFDRKLKDLIFTLFCYRSLKKTVAVIKEMKSLMRQIFGGSFYPKVVDVGGNYYSFPYTHAWGSPQYKRDLRTHLWNIMPHKKGHSRLLVVLMSITNKCPLSCEHCFEWDNINKIDKLSLSEIEESIQKIQSQGAISIHLSGGEPMIKMNEMLPIIKKHSKNSAFWVLSSGMLITEEMAFKMKKNGISVISLSLDHYLAIEHDRFRGERGTFKQVMKATKFCIDNDIVCILSICVTNENVNRDFLLNYMELAKDMGVAFVQILEPRSVGNYKGQKKELGNKEISLLEDFYLEMNFDNKFKHYPIIVYHGYQNRRIGCFSSGKYSLYIDANGDVMTCTFCRRKEGNILKDDLGKIANNMIERGCGIF